MSPIAPRTNSALTALKEKSQDLRREVSFQSEVLGAELLALHSKYIAHKEYQERLLPESLKELDDIFIRWDQRLARLEEWQKRILILQQEKKGLSNTVKQLAWAERITSRGDGVLHTIEHRLARIEHHEEALHEQITESDGKLRLQLTQLQDLYNRSNPKTRPLMVSRSRKQREIDAFRHHRQFNELFGRDLKRQRDRIRIMLARLRQALANLNKRASSSLAPLPIRGFEDKLRAMIIQAEYHRTSILNDALQYEAYRHALKCFQGLIDSLPCIEDVYKGQPSVWERLFSSN